ncbi:uncharacterized protein LOC127668474 [Apodemus sylvaticus]|uniref:uncharacterized protein LOC127668474 n=1 Tax=Apodemus sylvaticus TaxID=10129 RepID=UPI002242EC5B|nr:uncharacterized protein LOC127668474 [Apodemus sylvaticus]
MVGLARLRPGPPKWRPGLWSVEVRVSQPPPTPFLSSVDFASFSSWVCAFLTPQLRKELKGETRRKGAGQKGRKKEKSLRPWPRVKWASRTQAWPSAGGRGLRQPLPLDPGLSTSALFLDEFLRAPSIGFPQELQPSGNNNNNKTKTKNKKAKQANKQQKQNRTTKGGNLKERETMKREPKKRKNTKFKTDLVSVSTNNGTLLLKAVRSVEDRFAILVKPRTSLRVAHQRPSH